MDLNCAQCENLWKQYSEAAWEQAHVLGRIEAAVLERDFETGTALWLEVKAVNRRRLDVDRAIRQHEGRAHRRQRRAQVARS